MYEAANEGELEGEIEEEDMMELEEAGVEEVEEDLLDCMEGHAVNAEKRKVVPDLQDGRAVR